VIQEFLRPIHRGLQNAYSECFTQALQVRKRRVFDRVVMTVLRFIRDGLLIRSA
jgi:hypothetical protein